jgi:hypothetical protein
MQMCDVLEEFLQAPGAPNLYWAIANRPRPFLDIETSLEGERTMLEREIPRVRELDSGVWSREQARAFADELKQKYSLLNDHAFNVSSPSERPELKDFGSHVLFASLVARAYPAAKRTLIAEGRPAAQVEAMPAVQAVALVSYRQYEEARDDIFKWAGLPYWQGNEGMRRANDQPRLGWNALKSGIPFSVLLPAIQSAMVVPVRVDRRLDAIAILEAARLYAAAHGGKLPPTLDAMAADAPAPLDPASNTPFTYRVDGEKAALLAPPPPGLNNIPQYRLNYELKLAR